MKNKRSTDEIERASNRFLEEVLEELFQINGLRLIPYRLGELKEQGIDFIFEMDNRYNNGFKEVFNLSTSLFYLQNKGQDDEVKFLVNTKNKGMVSFQLNDIRQIEYFCYSLDQPLIISLCDLKTKTIFWCPIQLEIANYIEKIKIIKEKIENEIRETTKIQIYFDPKKTLCKNGVIEEANFNLFLTDIQNSKDLLYSRYSLKRQEYFSRNDLNHFIKIDAALPFLEQLFQYLTKRYRDINIIPLNILMTEFPFKIEKTSFSYYSLFTIYTDNEELFHFFESIKINIDGKIEILDKNLIQDVDGFEEKIKFIFSILRKNLIFNVEFNKGHRRFEIENHDDELCNCLICLYSRFEFVEVFKKLNRKPKDLDEKLKIAYVNYQIGNIVKSIDLFNEISRETKKEKYNTWHFISQYNLSKLSIFLRNHYWGDNKYDVLLNELRKIDFGKVLLPNEKVENEKIIDWIASNSFYSNSRDNIQKVSSKIKDQYYSHLRGGWSSNSYIWDLINKYFEIDIFLNNNYLIYDEFDEFKELFDVFLEGLFSSHSIGIENKSRLEAFDDLLLQKIVYYGKAERIISLFTRYNLKEIVYKSNSKNDIPIVLIFSNFLSSNKETRDNYFKYCESDNRIFWEQYNSFFENILVIAGITKFNESEINKIASDVAGFLEIEDSIRQSSIKYVSFFISRQGDKINISTLKTLLLLVLKRNKLHEESYIETIANQIAKQGKKYFSEKEYYKFKLLAFNECKLCKQRHSPTFFVFLFQLLNNQKLKDDFIATIKSELNKSFHPELFYLSTLFDIINPTDNFLQDFIKDCTPNPAQASIRKIFSGEGEDRFLKINKLVNLYYKYNLELSDSSFEEFKTVSKYYEWLFDLENFDYSLFDPKWIILYPTKHYYERFSKISVLKEKLHDYLKDNADAHLERVYFRIFC